MDFRNTNTLWASILAETLSRLGLQTAIICPGSRSAPLAVAFARHPTLEAIPILDERSAAFFALGMARRSGMPIALICTSGTAGANFFPAVIEAHESRVPLLVLTADRPPELRHCHAGQAINQVNLYGSYVQWSAELALPEPNPSLLAYLRQTLMHAWERSQFPVPGPIHLNIPFRDPLAPTPELGLEEIATAFDEAQFFQMVQPRSISADVINRNGANLPWDIWQKCDRGLIIAGPAIPTAANRYCQVIGQLSQHLGWPVLAEGLSPLRNFADLNPYLISTYDIALRNRNFAAQAQPEHIIRIGEPPTSKTLRLWLQDLTCPQWIIEPSDQNVDPLHCHAVHLRTTVEAIAPHQESAVHQESTHPFPTPQSPPPSPSPYLASWLAINQKLHTAINTTLSHTADLRESKVAWILSQTLPPDTPIFIANSMPIRDVELFWQPGNSRILPYFNRGANGIDGTLSSAFGMAHRQPSSVLLTGDLSLLHDTNGFLVQPHWQEHLTIVLINNNGGGIFGMLPIAAFEPPFETFFATPQTAEFAKLCAAYGVEHQIIQSWDDLTTCLNPLPEQGVRVLEVRCDRTLDAQWRKEQLQKWSQGISD